MSAYSIHSSLQDSFLPVNDEETHVFNVTNTPTYDQFAGHEEEPVYDVEDLDSQVNNAQEQLKRLRDEQEALQRKKDELEALNAKQSEFREGRADIVNKLTNAITEFDHEAHQLLRRAEAMQAASQGFQQHLQRIDTIRPEEWAKEGMHQELDHALEMIGDAEEDYQSEVSRIETLGGAVGAAAAKGAKKFFKFGRSAAAGSANLSAVAGQPLSFFYWLRSGLAFTLPVIVVGLVGLILILTALAGPAPAPVEPAALETALNVAQP
ncbi:MAG: hypothetical protein AAF585_24935 [Verrucomicrobiota bacterium]